jgi:phosphate transport system substrate-binding protein
MARTLLALAILLGTPALADDALLIAGSGYTMPQFADPWIAVFNARGGVQVSLERRGTATGPPALLSGRAQIAAMTRELNDSEREAFERKRGQLPVAIPVAADAIAIFVHRDNPLASLTPRQVDAIFSADRRCGAESDVTRWGDLGLEGEYAQRKIGIYGRRPGSGTGEFVRAAALCGGHYKTSLRVAPGPKSSALAIANDLYGIAFSSRGDLTSGTRAVPIETDSGLRSIAAEDVYSGAYPYSRRLYFYVDPPPLRAGLLDFIAFALSPDAQLAVEAAGYLAVPRAVAEQSLRALR